MLNDAQVTEDILVRHLDAEGALTADAAHRGWYVHGVDVLQATQADVNCDECAWIKMQDVNAFIMNGLALKTHSKQCHKVNKCVCTDTYMKAMGIPCFQPVSLDQKCPSKELKQG